MHASNNLTAGYLFPPKVHALLRWIEAGDIVAAKDCKHGENQPERGKL
jgi:hypothetical protein